MSNTRYLGLSAPAPKKKKIYELNDEELGLYCISSNSQFKDVVWSFINPTPGARKGDSNLNWEIELLDGSRLTDQQHVERIRWAKILTLTLFVLPVKGRAPAPGSAPGLRHEFKWILSWMSERGYHSPSELTPSVIQQYIEELYHFMIRHCSDEEISVSTAIRALAPLMRLWDQRSALEKMGVKSLSNHPFEGKGTHAVAKEIATKAQGWIKPIPDEVAIPLLNKAAWFLETPADDVIKLLDVVRDPSAGVVVPIERGEYISMCKAGEGKSSRLRRAKKFLDNFQFGTPTGEENPWHESLDVKYNATSERSARKMERVRELWESVRDAAAIVIQSTSGMRISELLGIKAGIDSETGLPRDVRLEKSPTGLYEWFVLRSVLSKTDDGLPREVDWVLGMRPGGSVQMPLAVRALYILNKIYEPWRTNTQSEYLFLSKGMGKLLPLASTSLRAMSNDTLNVTIKRFIERWIDLSRLPDESKHKSEDNDLIPWRESKGSIFSTHMLRKTWAQFTLACDPRLLPVIQMQFHHLSLAMTEGGYIGRNPLLIEALDSISLQKRNLMLFESLTGKTLLAGRMGEQLEQEMARLRATVGELSTSEKWKSTAEWADSHDLQMFFSAHATCCPTRTSEMRCHDTARTPVWLRKEPNSATREPSLCAGCACAVMDKSHEPFWSERYVTSEVTIKAASVAEIKQGYFREIRFRAEQARNILKKFGADMEKLDAQVRLSLEQEYA
ncbi:integrase [Massilia aurea]|uniref:integrase n=1 Tax=Massilia aurea TaxID=373040 RepID=UPI002161475B|nr:integrase [Massilia aurea]MCS0706489.1 integrase [Massilia aurea]